MNPKGVKCEIHASRNTLHISLYGILCHANLTVDVEGRLNE